MYRLYIMVYLEPVLAHDTTYMGRACLTSLAHALNEVCTGPGSELIWPRLHDMIIIASKLWTLNCAHVQQWQKLSSGITSIDMSTVVVEIASRMAFGIPYTV